MKPSPASAYDHRNESDIDSDNAYAARREQQWIGQSDVVMARRAEEVPLDDSPLPMTADGRTILPSGRVVRPSVAVSAPEPELDFAADTAARRGAISLRGASGRASLGVATAEDLKILDQFPSTQRIDSTVPIWGPSALVRSDGSAATYSFNERTGRAYWDLGEANMLREIPKAFKQPSLQELAFADPNNPFTNGPRLGNVLAEFGVASGAGAFGFGVGGVAARGLAGLASDVSALGLRGAYYANGAGIATAGVVAGELTLGYNALSPSPMLLGGAGGRSVLFSSSELSGVERASQALLGAVSSRRAVTIAEEGSDALRYLNYRNAEAAALGPEDIILRQNPSKAAVLEEFLHGTQQRLGIVDRLGTSGMGSAETHVKDFMIRHSQMLGLGAEDVRRLQILKDLGL